MTYEMTPIVRKRLWLPPDDLAFLLHQRRTAQVIQVEIMTYAGLVPLPDGETEVLFGTFSALEAAGAVKMIPAVETLRNYLKGCQMTLSKPFKLADALQ